MPIATRYAAAAMFLLIAIPAVVGPSTAQLPRYPVEGRVELAASVDGPAFRDPKTGQIWTPDNVSQDGKPSAPDDHAIDPDGQAVVVGRIVEQYARSKYIGQVPIMAWPTVPLIDLDNASLHVRPGEHWRVTLYLSNNFATVLAPALDCRFTNGGKLVEETRVVVAPTSGGARIGLVFFGPPSEIFVDLVAFRVTSP
jgi:hypothetical protein